MFCPAILKRYNDGTNITFNLSQKHSDSCIDYIVNDIKNKSNIISEFNDYVKKCYNLLDSQESYNKTEFIALLKDLYNDEKINYSFKLKDTTIPNIISRWKSGSLKFTKYNAIENKLYKDNNLILWDYRALVIYTSKKNVQSRVNILYGLQIL